MIVANLTIAENENSLGKADEKNFCHSNIVVSYLDDDYRSKPIAIEIYVDEGNWTFDFSQVLRRADQFKWRSGVF
jgi:hypothetical protein